MSRYTVNELLCFATSQFDKLDRNVLNSTLIDFYSQQEIFDAKQILLAECDKLSLNADINESRKKRIGQNVEQKLLKDILDIWQVIDSEKGGNLETVFVASNPMRLPSMNAENCNLQFLVSSILKLQEQSKVQEDSLTNLGVSVNALHEKFSSDSFSPLIAKRKRHFLDSTAQPFIPSKIRKEGDSAHPLVQSLSRSALTPTAQDLASAAPDLSLAAPGLSAVVPGLTSEPPGLTSAAPDLTSAAPDLTSAAPDLTSAAPDLTSAAPNLTPVTTTHTLTTPIHISATPVLSSLATPIFTSALAPVLTSSAAPVFVSSATPVFTSPALGSTSTSPIISASASSSLTGPDCPSPTAGPASVASLTGRFEEAIAAATAVGEASKTHTNEIVSSAVKSARKAKKAAKSAAKAAQASQAIATAKASTAANKKAEAEAAAAKAKSLREGVSNSLSAETLAATANSIEVTNSVVTSLSSSSSSSSLPANKERFGKSWLDAVREKRKTETIIGCKEGGDLEGVAPRIKDFWDLFISNLSDKATDFQIKSHLQSHGIEVKEVWILNSKKKGTKSAKARIAIEHKEKAKQSSVWSKFIRVQDWVRKPKNLVA